VVGDRRQPRGAAGRPLQRRGLGVISLAMLFNLRAGAYFHAGVEWKWWPGPAGMLRAADRSFQRGGDLFVFPSPISPSCAATRAAWRFSRPVARRITTVLISLALAAIGDPGVRTAAWRAAGVECGKRWGRGRLEAFHPTAVVAIIITIMVLEMKVAARR